MTLRLLLSIGLALATINISNAQEANKNQNSMVIVSEMQIANLKRQIEMAEDAAEKAPNSATIIDHLGDVYWKLGRLREAGYQWRHALDLDPTDEERARIEVKLKGGLEAAAGMP